MWLTLSFASKEGNKKSRKRPKTINPETTNTTDDWHTLRLGAAKASSTINMTQINLLLKHKKPPKLYNFRNACLNFPVAHPEQTAMKNVDQHIGCLGDKVGATGLYRKTRILALCKTYSLDHDVTR